MKLDLRAVERAIVFLNGDYWGVYSPRERPTDHDYTSEYYDQDKYDLQYLLTWGRTWAEYGGQQAFNDWIEFRDFIMTNDMSDSTNYQRVRDNMQVLGLIDYMLINLNVVSSDWLNYNTGWWRGLNKDGSHKKWGYLLWDNDATFDFYINYSGVPNINPDAEPCDIDDISEFMDEFFEGGNGFMITEQFSSNCFSIQNNTSPYLFDDPLFLEVVNEMVPCCFGEWTDACQALYDEIEAFNNLDPATCRTIVNGSCPYPADDPTFIETVRVDSYCCEFDWDGTCEQKYQAMLSGTFVDEELYENVGLHEKIFLKLQEENPDFRQLYYSRQADLNNTVFSCENMLSTLDSLTAEIAPEMPKHIERWGGSVEEWEGNIDRMRTFIESRCKLLDDGLVNCYGIEGPYALTLEVQPEGVGEIEINTIDVNSFPWTGNYYGNMDNLIEANVKDDEYRFVNWVSKSGHIIFPSLTADKARIQIESADTLIAVYEKITSTNEIESLISFDVYPSPTNETLNLTFQTNVNKDIVLKIIDSQGRLVHQQNKLTSYAGTANQVSFDVKRLGLHSGLYSLLLNTSEGEVSSKKFVVVD